MANKCEKSINLRLPADFYKLIDVNAARLALSKSAFTRLTLARALGYHMGEDKSAGQSDQGRGVRDGRE